MSSPTSSWQVLKGSADRARLAANHEQAIELYNQALSQPELPWEALSAMLLARAESYQMLGDKHRLDTELTNLASFASERGDYSMQSMALIQLCGELRYAGETERAFQVGAEAVQAADQSESLEMKVRSRCVLGSNYAYILEIKTAEEYLQAARQIASPGDVIQELAIRILEFTIYRQKGQYGQARQAAEDGLRLARTAGSRLDEGRLLNMLFISTPDQALAGSLLEQSLQAFKAIGARAFQNMILMNSSNWFINLGLYARAMEAASQSLQFAQDYKLHNDILYSLQFIGLVQLEMAEFEAARESLNQAIDLAIESRDTFMEVNLHQEQALAALYQGDGPAAREWLQRTEAYDEQVSSQVRCSLLSYRSIAAYLVGQREEAYRLARQALTLIKPQDFGNSDNPMEEVLWWCFRGLDQEGTDGEQIKTGLSKDRWQALNLGCQAVLTPVENMSDAGLRRGYLHRVTVRRLLIQEWLKWAPERVTPEELLAFTAQVQRPGRLKDIFRRLLAVGVRLNAVRDPVRLPDKIVEEISELTGAERIALVLLDSEGQQHASRVLLPRPPFPVMTDRIEPQPDKEAFLAEIAPWLDEVAAARQGFVRQTNPDAPLLEQRSLLAAPLLSQERLVGVVYADLTGCFGRFDSEDLDLLGVLANQAAVAAENADWSATLELKVAERTVELEQSNEDLEQRTAELTIINRVQEGLVKQLNFQAIIDLVGDEIRRIFPAPEQKAYLYSLFIALYDSETNLIYFPYWSSGVGERLYEQPAALGEGLTSKVIQTRKPIVLNTWEDAQVLGAIYVDDGIEETSQSWLGVPIFSGDRVTGVISIQDPRKNLYNDADIRLLTTLAASLGVALENARLFEETQRLFKAEQERVAELQIINSIQQGLAAEMDFQAIIDLVGDKLREEFHLQDIQIAWYDQKNEINSISYCYEHGERIYVPPQPYRPGGVKDRLEETRKPLVWNTAAEGDAISPVVPGTDTSKSGAFVPIISSDRVLGAIAVENYERESAYGEAELRLLTTVAASLGTALENAHLFDETQRLLKETEQRNSELAIINEIQQGLASKLDFQAIIDLVGDRITQIFTSDATVISLYDSTADRLLFPYFVEDGSRMEQAPLPLGMGFTSRVITSKEPLLFHTAEEGEAGGAVDVPLYPDEKIVESILIVPMMTAGVVKGTISVQSYQQYAYDQGHLRLLSTLTSSLSVALENARLFEETQRLLEETEQRNAELAIINSVQAALSAELNIQGIYDTVGDKIREIFHSADVAITIFDTQNNVQHYPYIYETGERVFLESLQIAETGFAWHVLHSHETLVINENMPEMVEKYGSYILPGTKMEKSVVYVPLLVGDQVRGMVSLSDFEREWAFSPADVRLLQTLANSMSVALENARLFEETQRLLAETSQRASELAIINSVSQSMSSLLDVEAIVRTVGDQLRDTLRSEIVNIALLDPKTNLIHLPYTYDRDYVTTPPFPFGEGLTSSVLRTRQPLILGSFEEIMGGGALLTPNAPGDELMPQSYLGVPIIVGEKAIGVIDVQSYQKFNYGERHVRLLSTLAASMGVALENARLFEETRRLLDETEQRNRELAIISRMGQALVGQLDSQGIYELVGEELAQIFDAQVVAIIHYDRQYDLSHWRYLMEKGQRQTVSPHPPAGFSRHILATRQPLLIKGNLAQHAAEMGSFIVAGEAPKSYLGVPLIAGGEVTGLISLQNIDREAAFTESDQRLLSTLALNMSVALENARLFSETNRRAEEMAALAEIGNDIAQTHDLQPVLERIARQAGDLLEVSDIALYLLEPDGQTLCAEVAFGESVEEIKASPVHLGQGLIGSVAASGLAEILNYPEKDPRAIHIEGTTEESDLSEAMMIASLLSRGKLIGTFAIWRHRAQGLFYQADLDLLVSLARQAAIAIESARLYMETANRATQMATLAEAGREISSSLNLQTVLENLASRAHEACRASTTVLRLAGADGLSYRAAVAVGEYAEQNQSEVLRAGEGITGSVILSGMAEIIPNTALDPRATHVQGTPEVEEHTETMMVAPLVVHGKTEGVLSLYRYASDGQFDTADLDFLTGLARQAAIAIENVRLFEAAQESQQRMADIIAFLPDATFVVDHLGKVIAWNRAIEEMTGLKAEEVLGKGDYEYALPFYGERRPILIDLVLESDENLEQRYVNVQRQGATLTGEALVPKLRGKPAFLNATASALRNAKGEIVGAIETIRDITDRKRAEEELQQAKVDAEVARQQAEDANQAKSAFLAMMSHEIRTPMNAIIGMSGLLMDTSLTTDQHEFAETIRNSGDALLTIINDILDFSKVEAGKMALEEQPFDLRECIEASLDLMKVRAAEKRLEMAYQMEADVPPALIGDVTRLRQVLINLLGNAVKFTEQGEIVLSVSKEEDDCLHFTVRDTGIGIPADRIRYLFQPFMQADVSTSRRYGGTGLGLALSKRLIELMGGKMWVESEGIPGKGSTFHFTLAGQPAPDWQGRPHLVGEQPQLIGRRLLVVDDHATNRRILYLQTQAWGMLTRTTATSSEALEWLRRGDPFDLAILDMQMPDMDGLELAQEIRKLEAERSTPRLPLVLFTSLGGLEEARGSQEFSAVLSKPLRQSALFDCLMTLFATQPGIPVRPVQERASLDPEMAAGHPLRILLAEDNVVNQKLALRLLSQMGYRADVAANGLEAIQAVERQPYDVILMDVQMPEMDGLEATRYLCAHIPTPQRPRIIAMTANAMQGDREMCLDAGMDDYISKPVRVEELVTALLRCQIRPQEA